MPPPPPGRVELHPLAGQLRDRLSRPTPVLRGGRGAGCMVLCSAAPAPGSYRRGALSPPGALLIPHCQPWQFLLGERVSGRAQQCALQGREIPEQNRKAAASLLHLALYPASPSSCCRDSDTPRSAEILPGTISVRQAEGCCPALPKRYHQRGPGHYRRVTISSC